MTRLAVHGGDVVDDLAPCHGAIDVSRIDEVAHDRLDAVGAQCLALARIAHQGTHPMSPPAQRTRQMAAREAGRPCHQNLHPPIVCAPATKK